MQYLIWLDRYDMCLQTKERLQLQQLLLLLPQLLLLLRQLPLLPLPQAVQDGILVEPASPSWVYAVWYSQA